MNKDGLQALLRATLVMIPACNEEKNIAGIITGIRREFPQLDILVVDDGSTDDTAAVARRAGATVLRLVNNMGYGIALQTAYKYAFAHEEYRYCLQMDGDGQHRYTDIPKLLTALNEDGVDLVIGSRFVGGENGYHIPFARRVGMGFFRMLLRRFTRSEVLDITSGFQAFRRHVLQFYTSDEMPYYYPDADVLMLLIRKGVNVREVATPMERGRGGSMHDGVVPQVYYVFTMMLSIIVILLKGRRGYV